MEDPHERDGQPDRRRPYSTQLASPALLERTERWLADATEPALKRLVVEGRDGVARALRAQERDAAD